MKITSIEIIPVSIPMTFSYGEQETVFGIVATVATDQGIEGLGHAITLTGRHFKALVVAAEELAELLIGEDPRQPERLHRKLLPDGGVTGGLANVAVSALDVAIWDLAGKSAGLPLYRMLGGFRNRVPAYASLRLADPFPLPSCLRSPPPWPSCDSVP